MGRMDRVEARPWRRRGRDTSRAFVRLVYGRECQHRLVTHTRSLQCTWWLLIMRSLHVGSGIYWISYIQHESG